MISSRWVERSAAAPSADHAAAAAPAADHAAAAAAPAADHAAAPAADHAAAPAADHAADHAAPKSAVSSPAHHRLIVVTQLCTRSSVVCTEARVTVGSTAPAMTRRLTEISDQSSTRAHHSASAASFALATSPSDSFNVMGDFGGSALSSFVQPPLQGLASRICCRVNTIRLRLGWLTICSISAPGKSRGADVVGVVSNL